MKEKIVFIVNHDVVIYNFRRELVERLISMNYEIYILSPYGKKIEKLLEIGCVHIKIDVNRHGKNIFEEFRLFRKYYKELKKINPKVVLTYTIKPNIYGGMAAMLLKIPFISNVTGLGSALENKNPVQKISSFLYTCSLKRAFFVFFQNKDNMNFFKGKLKNERIGLLPGSGVNLSEYQVLKYPTHNCINFLFLARIMKDKGIEEYLSVAKIIRENSKNVYFHIAGFIDGDYKETIEEEAKKENIIYHGMVDDVVELFKTTDCLVLPSYHEGMSNVLLEACACGRPVIATNIAGCREIVDDNKTGFLCNPRSTDSLYQSVNKFLDLSSLDKMRMGKYAREKVEKNFDRQVIVEKYLERIEEL